MRAVPKEAQTFFFYNYLSISSPRRTNLSLLFEGDLINTKALNDQMRAFGTLPTWGRNPGSCNISMTSSAKVVFFRSRHTQQQQRKVWQKDGKTLDNSRTEKRWKPPTRTLFHSLTKSRERRCEWKLKATPAAKGNNNCNDITTTTITHPKKKHSSIPHTKLSKITFLSFDIKVTHALWIF